MPITIRHGDVALAGKLAVTAGRAQGQAARAAREASLSQAAATARWADLANIRAATNQRYALQRAAAVQMARKLPTDSEFRSRQRTLVQTVTEAEKAGIYDSAQIQQMRIFASMGDEDRVKSILARLPQPPAAERELGRQREAFGQLSRERLGGLNQELGEVESQLRERYVPGMWDFLRERPDLIDPKFSKLLARQQELRTTIEDVNTQAAETDTLLRLGISIPAQMQIEAKQVERDRRAAEKGYDREMDLREQQGELSDIDNLAIDTIRDEEIDLRKPVHAEMARLRKDLAKFDKESEKDFIERSRGIQAQLQASTLQIVQSHAREKKRLGVYLANKTPTPTGDYPREVRIRGVRWKFIGHNENGEPIYQVIE